MDLLRDALLAGHAVTRVRAAQDRAVLVIGGGGSLGAAVLEQLLASRRFGRVGVLVERALSPALRGLSPVAAIDAAAHDTAVIVFDRARHANGRERTFVRPEPSQLPALATALRRADTQHLVVVVPHSPAQMPAALRHGLANLDEHAVAALGFAHTVFMRSAEGGSQARADRLPQRVADWVLAQLSIMVSQHDQPVRVAKVAQLAVQLAWQIEETPEGTRVVPPEIVWRAAQTGDVAALASAWLHGRELPVARVKPMRM